MGSIPPTEREIADSTAPLSAGANLRWHTRLIGILFVIGATGGSLVMIGIAQSETEFRAGGFIVGFGYALTLIVAAIGILRLSPWARQRSNASFRAGEHA